MFETDYEDFIIELFSRITSNIFFFKVSDKIFAHIHIPGELAWIDDSNPTKLCIPLFVSDLKERYCKEQKLLGTSIQKESL